MVSLLSVCGAAPDVVQCLVGQFGVLFHCPKAPSCWWHTRCGIPGTAHPLVSHATGGGKGMGGAPPAAAKSHGLVHGCVCDVEVAPRQLDLLTVTSDFCYERHVIFLSGGPC